MQFSKYHALGNDYLVVNPAGGDAPTAVQIPRICHRHYGIGSDGMLLGPLPSKTCDFGVRIFNPDGGEAEKSGNGLRIFSRYLYDRGLVGHDWFTIETLGGNVAAQIEPNGRVAVQMGAVIISEREALVVDGRSFPIYPADIGNPHCVILQEQISETETRHWGEKIERHGRFPQRTNVQFMKIVNRAAIQIQIWERGAGYTLASGSSSCAAAAVAHKLGLCGTQIAVHMPGGAIDITIGDDFSVLMCGAVTKIADGTIAPELFTSVRS